MNKLIVAIFALLLLTFSCTGGKTGSGEQLSDSGSVDTDTVATDTMEQLITETPMPKAADELFDDFFFNFAANRRLQMQRIKFPLQVTVGGKTTTVEKKAWKTDHFFMRQGYYTLLFDSRKHMDVVKDTNVNHVAVEKIDLSRNTVKKYIFDRENGLWMMERIENEPLGENSNASFLKFYKRFAVDTAFQARHLASTVKFVGPDPDDDFSDMTGLLTPDTWPAFAPELPCCMIYNISYGESYSESNRKIFVLRGISNGLEVELTFRRVGGKWLLTQLNT